MWVFFYLTITIHKIAGKVGGQFSVLSTTFTRVTNTFKLNGKLLKRAHLCAKLVAGLELATSGF